ncbi:MAG: phosphate signaling complex protein PhoU [Planctomycetota bacterium]
MSTELELDLEALRRELLLMGYAARDAVRAAFESLDKLDAELAQRIRSADVEINRMYTDIESHGFHLLALRAPVARDLRAVIASMRIAGDFERLGDCAKGIAKRVIAITSEDPLDAKPAFGAMTEIVSRMLEDSLSALSAGDAVLARVVWRSDAAVDREHRVLTDWCVDGAELYPGHARVILEYAQVVRLIERIGDHCTNVAEEVLFTVEGEKSHPQKASGPS